MIIFVLPGAEPEILTLYFGIGLPFALPTQIQAKREIFAPEPRRPLPYATPRRPLSHANKKVVKCVIS